VFIRGGRFVMDNTSGIVGETVIGGTPHIIDIGVDSLLIQNGSGIDFESFGSGASTNAIIRARQIELIGTSTDAPTGILVGGGGVNPSGNIFIAADSVRVQGSGTLLGTGAVFGTGRAGDLTIQANSLSVTDGAAVIALSATSGNAGSIQVNADTVYLANRGSILSNNTGTGNGGPISIDARLITLENHGVITSSSLGTGNAGNIWLRARDSISLASGSVISTQAKQGAGGNIAIIAGNKLLLRESSISTSVDGPASNGGNIDIDPVFVVLDNSRILARAVGGNGGNIHISTQYLLQSTDSVIDASSQLGVNGRVVIAGTDVDLDSDLAPLPSNFLNAKLWLSAACVNRQGNDVSQFTVNGRDGVYRSSSDFALSPMMFDALPAAASIEGSAAGYVDSRWAAATLLTQSPVWLRPACSHDPG
jgi:large exoprotein involved in heme utilization and adhesion